MDQQAEWVAWRIALARQQVQELSQQAAHFAQARKQLSDRRRRRQESLVLPDSPLQRAEAITRYVGQAIKLSEANALATAALRKRHQQETADLDQRIKHQ